MATRHELEAALTAFEAAATDAVAELAAGTTAINTAVQALVAAASDDFSPEVTAVANATQQVTSITSGLQSLVSSVTAQAPTPPTP